MNKIPGYDESPAYTGEGQALPAGKYIYEKGAKDTLPLNVCGESVKGKKLVYRRWIPYLLIYCNYKHKEGDYMVLMSDLIAVMIMAIIALPLKFYIFLSHCQF